MDNSAKFLILLGMLLLLAAPASAWVNTTLTQGSPSNDSVAPSGISLVVNATFSGTANITLNYTNSSQTGILNVSNLTTSPYSFSWDFSAFPDGRYNLTLVAVNSSNASDAAAIGYGNITIDQTAPTASTPRVAPNATYRGTLYTNATPAFTTALADALSGLAGCQYAQNSTVGFTSVAGYGGGASCAVTLGTFINAQVLNVTFRANDTAGNTGANSTRLLVTVDAAGPAVAFNTAAGIYSDGDMISVSANITDAGVNVTNSTACPITIDGQRTGFSGSVIYLNTTGRCEGTITLGSPSGFADGAHTLALAVNDTLNNTGSGSATITVDNSPPLVPAVSVYPRNPADGQALIEMNVTVNDTHNVSAVMLTNGSYALPFAIILGDETNGTYGISFTPDDFSCRNESICALTVVANDTLNNTNNSMTTGSTSFLNRLIILDTDAPVTALNSTNTTSADPGSRVLFYAKWSDIGNHYNLGLPAILEIYNATLGAFQTGNNTYLANGYFGMNNGNYSNMSYTIPGSLEGRTLTGRIRLNDSNGHTNTTSNLTVAVNNISPVFSGPENNSYIISDGSIVFTMLDVGAGSNLSTLAINVTGSSNLTITYAQNASLFACGRTYVNATDNLTCSVSTDWPLGNFSMRFDIGDYAGNPGNATYAFYAVQDQPEIVNVTINGIQLTNETYTWEWLAFTNSSGLTNITWSVLSTLSVNRTSFILTNTTAGSIYSVSSSTAPATAMPVLTAGFNMAVINLTMNPDEFLDEVTLYITANIPLNLTRFRDLQVHGLITAFNVTSGGTDITSTTDYINKTIDITVIAKNATNVVPFTATVTYHDLDGLSLWWNASDAFNMTMRTLDDGNNYTIILQNNGSIYFFDQQYVLTTITFNISKTNRSFYFNDPYGWSTLIGRCAAVPASLDDLDEFCYTNTTSSVTVYLSRFDAGDSLLVVEPPVRAPAITNYTAKAQSNSIIPLDFSVDTPFPNATLCRYNVSYFNASNVSVPYQEAAIPLSAFTIWSKYWWYEEDVYAADGRYNVSINCSDEFGTSSLIRFNVNITDTVAPVISGVDASNVTRYEATIGGTANENVTFTVKYGTNPDLINTTLSQEDVGTIAEVTLEDLIPDTRYYYNLTACDLKGWCSTSATYSFKTGKASAGAGGGAGGAAPAPAPTDVQATDSRVFGIVHGGDTVTYKTALAFSEISLHFTEDVVGSKITIKQYTTTPKGIPSVQGTVYKYLSIDHQMLKVDKHQLTLSVENAWMTAQHIAPESIRLYRYEDGAWKEYKPVLMGAEKGKTTYLVTVPGFSYFAIGSATVATPAVTAQDPTAGAAQQQGSQPAEQPQVQQPAEFIEAKPRSKSVPAWLLISAIVVIACVGSVVGLKQYQVYKVKEAQHLEEVRAEGEKRRVMEMQLKAHERAPDHDPMAQLHQYISAQRAKGTPDDVIRQRLLSVGWDEFVVNMEMMRR